MNNPTTSRFRFLDFCRDNFSEAKETQFTKPSSEPVKIVVPDTIKQLMSPMCIWTLQIMDNLFFYNLVSMSSPDKHPKTTLS